jgi:transcriptional regulator
MRYTYLTKRQVEEVKRLREKGTPLRKIAKLTKVSLTHAWKIVTPDSDYKGRRFK